MRKGFLIVLVVVLAAAFAAPAMAGTDINGFYKSRAFMTNYVKYFGGAYGATVTNPGKDLPTMAYVEQRFRLRIASGDENVKAVAHFEIDSVWGDNKALAAGNGGGAGGGLGTDSVNVETKNAYVWFRLPNSNIDFTVGLQGQSDSYAGVFMNYADMGGVFMNAKLDPVTLRLGWAKWTEGELAKWDDRTLYLAEVKFTPAKEVKLGANFYVLQDDRGRAGAAAVTGAAAYSFIDNNGLVHVTPAVTGVTAGTGASTQRIYMPGFDATFGAGPATINAWAFYQFGKYKDFVNPATADVKISGFAADVRADLNAGPGKAFVEALYISGGDNNSVKYKSIVDSGYTNSLFIRTDMQILLLAADVNTGVSGLYMPEAAGGADVTKSMGNGGRGMTHLATGFTMKVGDRMSAKVGAGYLAANKKLRGTDNSRLGKTMGTELNATLNYSLMKGLDVGLVGAYAWTGDFFDTAAAKADNLFDVHARIGYVF
jgi:hypothetical protein